MARGDGLRGAVEHRAREVADTDAPLVAGGIVKSEAAKAKQGGEVGTVQLTRHCGGQLREDGAAAASAPGGGSGRAEPPSRAVEEMATP